MTGNNATLPLPDLELDAWLERFEAQAAGGAHPDPSDFLPDRSHPKYDSALRELLRLDLEFAWGRGEERHVEDYRYRFPSLFKDPAALADVAREEYRQRRAAGEDPDPAEYRRRLGIDLGFPDKVPEPAAPTWDGNDLPKIGDVVPPGYRLTGELGRGAFGRVYLAEQTDLADRKVAIKVSSRLIGEAQTLARLQHTHIVPVYAVHRVGTYQLLVMPYLGGTTLADVIAGRPASARGTEQPAATVKMGDTHRTVAQPEAAHSCDLVVGPAGPPLTERQAIDIGIAVADALAHAHDRGILHRDVKPANVLLTDDGQPMLLDFNLAADDRAEAQSVGGTPRYMAPEQLEAMTDPTVRVDGRADVYALGLVLYELLLGRRPFPDREVAGLADRRRPPVIRHRSPALAAILRTCLEPDPAKRYPTAAALRDDLIRHRDNRPLRVAREPFSRERVRKWAKRHPRLTSGASVAAGATLLLALAAIGGYSVWRNNQVFKAEESRAAVRLARNEVLPLVDVAAPDSQLRDARRKALDAVAPYDLPDKADWLAGPLVRPLPAEEVERLREDVGAILWLAARATGDLAGREADPATRQSLYEEALALNHRAGEAYPTNKPVSLVVEQRQWLLDRAGRPDEARNLNSELDRAVPARLDTYLRAAVDLQRGRAREAAEALERLTRDGPPVGFVWWELGKARLRLGQYDRAADAFFAAGAILPDSPGPHFDRGVSLMLAGRYEPAIESFDRVLALKQEVPEAWLNRAIARLRRNQGAEALKDLAEAERHGASAAQLHALRELAYRQTGEVEKAAAEHRLAVAAVPRGYDDYIARGEARVTDDPAGAVADFDEALALIPDDPVALRDKANALSEHLKRPADAAKVLDRLMASDAARVEDRAGYAVLLARLGRADDARKQARACLADGTPALPLYQAASALALTARTADDRKEVIDALRRVLRADPAWAREMPDDPDLKTIHSEPAFRALLDAAGVLAGPGR